MRNLIKKKMIDAGRDDFVNYLAELLGCSKQVASNKLNGGAKLTEKDISVLTMKLGLTADELKKAIVKG